MAEAAAAGPRAPASSPICSRSSALRCAWSRASVARAALSLWRLRRQGVPCRALATLLLACKALARGADHSEAGLGPCAGCCTCSTATQERRRFQCMPQRRQRSPCHACNAGMGQPGRAQQGTPARLDEGLGQAAALCVVGLSVDGLLLRLHALVVHMLVAIVLVLCLHTAATGSQQFGLQESTTAQPGLACRFSCRILQTWPIDLQRVRCAEQGYAAVCQGKGLRWAAMPCTSTPPLATTAGCITGSQRPSLLASDAVQPGEPPSCGSQCPAQGDWPAGA